MLWQKMARNGGAVVLGLWLTTCSATTFAETLTAEDAVQLALANHLDIRIAANSEKQAEYTLKSAKGANGLSIDTSNTSYLKKTHQSNPGSNSEITFSLPLYSGGKNEGNIAVAGIDLEMTKLALDRTKQDVRMAALTAYFDALQALKTVKVDQESVDNYASHLENVQAQYSVGNVAKSDVLRSEVELADAQQTLVKAQNTYEVAMNNLRNVIRWKSAETFELAPDFDYVPVEKNMDECVAFAKTNRPDLKKTELSVKEAEKSVAVAQADKKPSVSLTAGTSWTDTALPKSPDDDFYIGLTTSWNLYDSQTTDAKVKKAQVAIDTARLNLESQTDSVELAVKEYYLGVGEAKKRIDTTQVAIHKAEEDYFIAEAKYRVGAGVMLDVIDAQLALTTARNNYIAAQHDYATYKAELENAMGMTAE